MVIGSHTIDELLDETQIIKVTDVISHESYDQYKITNDIALFRLAVRIIYKYIAFIKRDFEVAESLRHLSKIFLGGRCCRPKQTRFNCLLTNIQQRFN